MLLSSRGVFVIFKPAWRHNSLEMRNREQKMLTWWRRQKSLQWVIHPVSGAYCWESGDTDGSPKSISRKKVQTQMECCTCRGLVLQALGGVCCAGDGFSMTVCIARDRENIRWWVGKQEVMIWHQMRDVGRWCCYRVKVQLV